MQETVNLATTGSRSYRVSEAASEGPRQKFIECLAEGFHKEQATIPTTAWARSTRVLLFRMLSRAGAAAEQLLFQERKGFPFKLFKALREPVERFTDSPCMLDRLSWDVIQKYRDLRTDEAQAVLHGLAALIWTDIAAVESTHASTRRITVVKSTQATSTSFETANSEHVSRQLSTLRLLMGEQQGSSPLLTRIQMRSFVHSCVHELLVCDVRAVDTCHAGFIHHQKPLSL